MAKPRRPRILIEATTSSGNFNFSVAASEVPATLTAYGLAGVEEIDLMRVPQTGSVQAATDADGTPLKFTASITDLVITAPGYYRADKDSTSGSASLEMIPS